MRVGVVISYKVQFDAIFQKAFRAGKHEAEASNRVDRLRHLLVEP